MNRYKLCILMVLVLVGCKTTYQFTDLPLTEGELLSNKWKELERVPARYPIEEARAKRDGCTSVEYVITPNNEIEDIKVISSTSKYFAKEAKIAIRKWKLSALPAGIIQTPVKTVTQFQFCFDSGNGHCSGVNPIKNSQCIGEDTILSIGSRTKRRVYLSTP